MRITPLRPEPADIAASGKTTRTPEMPASSRTTAAANPALASEVLTAAAQRMDAMPEVDLARVAEVRAALARGEIGLDAAHLANIIAAYHRS